MASTPIFEADDLTIRYSMPGEDLTAVSEASFTLREGEYLGVVGESGCGKSTIAKAIVGGLDENGYIASGSLRYKGDELSGLSERELNEKIRWKEISYIPQSSMNSLDPLERIVDQAVEIAKVHTDKSKSEITDRLASLFETVGLNPSRITDYPNQFSGGMQQRAIIAFSLLLDPAIIIADEPTTALDVIMQDQIFQYLSKIQAELEVSMVLITHDISLVFESCSKIAVMHSGQIAEIGDPHEVYNNPRHPYSILLQRAFPDIRYPNRTLEVIEGSPPENTGEINQCTFVDRCPWAVEECAESKPPLEAVAESPDSSPHKVSCFRKDEMANLVEDLELADEHEVSGKSED